MTPPCSTSPCYLPSSHRLGFFLSACYLAAPFTDAEYEKLGQLANPAKLGRSEYIVAKLGLDK